MSFLLGFGVFLLIFVFVLFFIGVSLLRGALSIFFPSLRKKRGAYQAGNPFGGQQASGERKVEEESYTSQENKSRKKIFDKEDGEYVDFEECRE
ncbi:MAG: DUF4834 family protein [Bacteroidales bacterium]